MKILTKVVENLANDPMEPKFRRINTTKKPVQEKLLKWKTLVSFLENLGFTKGESEMNMVGFNSELIRGFYDAIIEEMKTNTEAFGVTVSSGFDPYAQHSSSTTGERQNDTIRSKTGEANRHDPDYIEKCIKEEKRLKRMQLEREVPDRDIQVFSNQISQERLRERQREQDAKFAEEETEWEDNIRNKSVLKMLADNQNQKKFKSKRHQELEKVKKQKVFSRSCMRIVFPDGMTLQGRFGALEKMGEVYDFVFENMYDKQSEFILYESPPKREFLDRNASLHKLGLCPAGKLYFQWKDEEAPRESSYVLDIKTLEKKIQK